MPNAGKESTHVEDKTVLVGVERPLNFALPDPLCPIALFAGGSGIGPFRAFIQKREEQAKQTGIRSENWIFFGCRNEKSFLYRKDWEDVIKRNIIDLHVIVAFSRENIHVESSPDGLKVVEGRSGKYVADVIFNTQNLSNVVCDLLLPIKHGGKEGYFYVCGAVPFYQGLISRLRENYKKRRPRIKSIIGGCVCRTEVQDRGIWILKTSHEGWKRRTPSQVSKIWYSELAVHNASAENDEQWFAVNGSVYDVSSFYETHPGGKE